MKKLFLLLVMGLCVGLMAQAVPARPGTHTMTQSDGTTLRIHAVGNAFNHALLTEDNLMVAQGVDGDFYYYSSLTGLTAVRAHEAGKRSAAEVAFINAQRGSLSMASKQRLNPRGTMLGVGGSNAESGVPANGQRRIPIILVEFKDKKFNNTRQDIIDAMLTGDESVGQYFRDQSNGVYQPDFEVFGIYELSQNREYYGGHSGGNNDKGLGYLVTEACELAAADNVSFKPYDTNNDDYCDVVIVIYAGVGEAQAYWTHPEAVWPCNWDLSSAAYYGMGGQGAFRPNPGDPYVNTFAVFNELYGSNDSSTTIDGIGTFAHEFGHCLGLPDFYDTNDSGHFGMGDWSIMCMGCYNNNGFTPAGYTAYEKNFMGWIEFVTPQPGTYYTLPVWNQKQAATDKAVCIVSDLNENECFIFENRKKQGWDRYMPGEGILVTHVTYVADRWWSNTPNNEDIQLMTIVPADNSLNYYSEDTDPWPQNGKTELTDNSTPAAKLYMRANGSLASNAGYLGKPVTEMVINGDGTASFWFMKDAITNPVISVSTDNIDFGDVMMTNSGTQTFKVMGGALTGDVTLTLNDADGVFSVNPAVISAADAANGLYVTVTFTPDAIRDYAATVTLSSEGAQDVVVNLTGHGLIEGYAPVMQEADYDFVHLTQFRADWTDDQTPAQNVASYTLEVKTKPLFSLLETADFSDVPDALTEDGQGLDDISSHYWDYLPEGWSGTSYLGAYGNALILAYDGTVKTPMYNFKGYGKVTVVVKASSYYYDEASISVSTSMGTQELTLGEGFSNYTVVLDCAEADAVTIKSLDNFSSIRQVTVYAGEEVAGLRAAESGDDTYRLITGITDKHYVVKGLTAGGNFIYKVKSLFVDGTESAWSNIEEVYLIENVSPHVTGDVDHDGNVTISDVTVLIDYLLGSAGNACTICADVDQDGNVSISDVTALIDILLSRK